MKRYISVSLRYWATERWRRRSEPALPASVSRDSVRPLVLTAPGQGGLRITAVDAHAEAEGLHPGQRLADARASVPLLDAADADPVADAAALGRLADWCGRYTPWTAVDGDDGLILDISGCAHLFGGEPALLADLTGRLARSGITARVAAADTPAAAWAWARFGANLHQTGAVLESGSRDKLAALPVEALRLPAATVDSLRRLGLRRIRDIGDLPRAPLAARLGAQVLTRLDRLFGVENEAISPRREAALWRARLGFADGISRREDLDAATRQLLQELSRTLAADGRGVRRLELAFYRLDGTAQFLEVGTSRPTRDVAHLMRLFAEPLGTVEPGFGIETMILGAVATDPLAAEQMALADARRAVEELAPIADRLQNRLGRNAVVRLVSVDSHCPERAVTVTSILQDQDGRTWPAGMMRPVQLLAAPEPIDVDPIEIGQGAVDAADQPPASFRWRRTEHRVATAEGPERIAPEWWRENAGSDTRDYYWLQDSEGRRYWVYRVPGDQPRWYLHGLFA